MDTTPPPPARPRDPSDKIRLTCADCGNMPLVDRADYDRGRAGRTCSVCHGTELQPA